MTSQTSTYLPTYLIVIGNTVVDYASSHGYAVQLANKFSNAKIVKRTIEWVMGHPVLPSHI